MSDMPEDLEGTDTPERPWKTCNDCNYDRHTCQGCGTPTTHAQGRCCPACANPTCPGTPHRGHLHDDEPCPIVDARGIPEDTALTVGDVLVEYFFVAKFAGRCGLNPEHRITPGDDVGMGVEAANRNARLGVLCTECVNEVTA